MEQYYPNCGDLISVHFILTKNYFRTFSIIFSLGPTILAKPLLKKQSLPLIDNKYENFKLDFASITISPN